MSRKKAIDEMCKQCIYDGSGNGSWRKQTEECPSDGVRTKHKCPLWDFRPLTLQGTRERTQEKREGQIDVKEI